MARFYTFHSPPEFSLYSFMRETLQDIFQGAKQADYLLLGKPFWANIKLWIQRSSYNFQKTEGSQECVWHSVTLQDVISRGLQCFVGWAGSPFTAPEYICICLSISVLQPTCFYYTLQAWFIGRYAGAFIFTALHEDSFAAEIVSAPLTAFWFYSGDILLKSLRSPVQSTQDLTILCGFRLFRVLSCYIGKINYRFLNPRQFRNNCFHSLIKWTLHA